MPGWLSEMHSWYIQVHHGSSMLTHGAAAHVLAKSALQSVPWVNFRILCLMSFVNVTPGPGYKAANGAHLTTSCNIWLAHVQRISTIVVAAARDTEFTFEAAPKHQCRCTLERTR